VGDPMSALLGPRREIAGSFPSCPDFVRKRCGACLRASIQTKDETTDSATRMRRNVDLAARTSVPMREPEQRPS